MNQRASTEVTPRQAGVVLAAALAVPYLLTRTRDLGGDDTVFALAIEAFLRKGALWWDFLHPHHVLYNPLVGLVTAAARRVAPAILAIDVGAAVSAVIGATAVGLLAALLARRGVPTGTALLAATAVGLSGGYWAFSTRLEVYTLEALAVLAWLAVLSRPDPSPRAAGAAFGASMLAHLALAVLAPATALGVRPPWRRRIGAVILGLAVPLVVLGTVVLFRALHGGAATDSILPSSYHHYLGPPRAGAMARALTNLLWWGWYRSVPALRPGACRMFDVMAVLATGVAFLLVGAGFLSVIRRRAPRIAVTAALALAGFVPLWLLWDAGNVEHTVASAPLWGVLLAVGSASLPRRWGPALLVFLVTLLATGNGLGSAIPQSRPENGRIVVVAGFVNRTVPENGLVLSLGRDPRLRLGLGYLSGRHIVDLTLAAESARAQGRSPGDALAYWLARGRTAGTVWLTPDVTAPDAGTWVTETLGIEPDAWRAAFRRIQPLGTRTLSADGIALPEPFTLTRASVH